MYRVGIAIAAVLCVGLFGCGGSKHAASTTTVSTTITNMPLVRAATAKAILDRIAREETNLPSSYNGVGFPGGGNQGDVAARWNLVAEDVQRVGDQLRSGQLGAVTGEVSSAADAADLLSDALKAISQCIANDDANFGGTRSIASVCPGNWKEAIDRAKAFGAALASIANAANGG
jgi:hypothetical protein